MTREEVISNFDPNGPGRIGSLFGLPFDENNAELIIIPVPWEVTVSYRTGTANGPTAILNASTQVDLFCKNIPNAWTLGTTLLPVPAKILEDSSSLRAFAEQHIKALESGSDDQGKIALTKINEACNSLVIYIKNTSRKILQQGKLVGILGGDHSTPLGLIHALGERYESFAILQIDAHADLRKSYEDFTYSHASIMFNALKIPSVKKLVQVGIRDLCEEEYQVIQKNPGRISVHFDEDLKNAQLKGETWASLCEKIVKGLPDLVYISFDIDGLDPKLCPHTGTPVPGGLQFEEIRLLMQTIVLSGKRIIGFDLCEVAPGPSGDWDANVGARVLFELCKWTGVSNGKLDFVH